MFIAATLWLKLHIHDQNLLAFIPKNTGMQVFEKSIHLIKSFNSNQLITLIQRLSSAHAL